MRTPSLSTQEAEAVLGPRGTLTVTFDNRKTVRKWLTACGVSSLIASSRGLSDLEKAYNDTTDAELNRLRTMGNDLARAGDEILDREPAPATPAPATPAPATPAPATPALATRAPETPNVPRYLAGDPAHMVAWDNSATRKRPVLMLINDLSTQAIVDQKCLFNRACIVAAIIDVIEAAGFACGVVAKYEACRDAAYHWHGVIIKEPEQPADIGRLAFSGHPSMLRRLLFGAAAVDRHIEIIDHGLGEPGSVPRKPLPENTYRLEPVTMTNSDLFKSNDAAASGGLDMLVQSLRDQGCPAFPQEVSDAA